MYQLEPELAESDYRGAFTETLVRFRRRALLVVLTELADQAVAETLLPALPLIARSHLVVIGAVQDPDLVAVGRGHADRRGRVVPQGGGPVAPSRSAGGSSPACGAWARRSSTDRPARLAPALADAYLRVKATGRL